MEVRTKLLKLENVVLEVVNDDYQLVRISTPTNSFQSKRIEDLIAEEFGNVHSLADIVITVELKQTNTITEELV